MAATTAAEPSLTGLVEALLKDSRTPTLATILGVLAKESIPMSTKDVAAAIGVTPWQVRKLINAGELRAIDMGAGAGGNGTRWRIEPEDLRAFLASRESRPRDLVAT